MWPASRNRLALLAALLVDVFHVLGLEVGAVAQHRVAQVARGGRGVDRPAVAGLHERGDAAAVVDVGVGEDDGVDLLRGERHRAVRLERLLAVALQEAAVEEDAMSVVFDAVEGAGGGARGAEEAEVEHGRGAFRSDAPSIRPAAPRAQAVEIRLAPCYNPGRPREPRAGAGNQSAQRP